MTLAIAGGTPVRSLPFPPWPRFDDTERQALRRALESGRWGRSADEGEAAAFEAEFARAHGAAAAVAVTNGTHALQLAAEVLGVRAGDEVIVPAFTPIPTSNAVQQQGAVPVPVDVDPATHCLDPALLPAACTARTSAVIPVHLGGHVADLDLICEQAQRSAVPVIQDAAHAHGARWRGQELGRLGTVATFSFQNSKVMTAGEGGAVLVPDGGLYEQVFTRHNVGRPPSSGQVNVRASSNYRMGEFAAAVLRAQLARLAADNERRERRRAELDELMAQVPGVTLPGRDPRCDRNSHYLTILLLGPAVRPVLSRDEVVRALNAEGIPAVATFPPIYRTAAFWDGPTTGLPPRQDLAAACPNAELLGDWGVMLPHRVLLGGRREVQDVAEAFAKVLAHLDR